MDGKYFPLPTRCQVMTNIDTGSAGIVLCCGSQDATTRCCEIDTHDRDIYIYIRVHRATDDL